MLTNFQDLVALIEKFELPHQGDAERSAVEVGTRIRGEAGRMLIVWDTRAALLHVIHPLAIEVSPERTVPMAEAVVRVNHALVLPGFGCDLNDRSVYFRWVVPRHMDGTMTDDEVDRAVRTVLGSVRDFLPALRAVAAGASPGDVLTVAEATKYVPGQS